MSKIPELVPISELRLRQSEVLERLPEGPVVLTQRGRAAAVLVDPDQWNSLISELEDLLDAADLRAARDTAESFVDFDDYLMERGENVQATA